MAEPTGSIFWYNRRWYEYTGTTPEQMKGWGWKSVHDPARLPSVMEKWENSIRDGVVFEMEFPLRRHDGFFGWFLTRVIPLRGPSGEIVRWSGTNTDITEIKTAEQLLRDREERLRRSEDTLRLALDSAQMGEWDWNLLTGELTWSDRCKSIFGFPLDASMNLEVFLAAIHPDDRQPVNQAVQNALHNENGSYSADMRVPWQDGTTRRITSKGRVFRNEDGERIRMIGVAQDLTERHRVEERVREAQKLESLGLLAGGVAHDFNNLLTGIMTGSSVAIEMTDPDSTLRPVLDMVLRSSERAAELTRQMLAYSGKGQFVIQPFDLSAKVRRTVSLVQHFISRKVRVELDLKDDLPPFVADASQIEQVIMNLLTNAGEAIGDNPGTIRIATSLRSLDAFYVASSSLKGAEIAPGLYIVLTVTDTGGGMNEETQARIFDPFFSTKFTGRGLGLAAVQGILRGHNAAIQVKSEPGRGTEFQVFFPAPVQDCALPQHTPVPSPPADQKAVILVVDDEEVVRFLARSSLARDGHTVLMADTGEDALQLLKQHAGNVSLVILDLSMPGLSGKQTLPELRRVQPGIRVVISSGYSQAQVIQTFESEDISGVLHKPYTVARLREAVSMALRNEKS